MMPDREKVIKGLEQFRNDLKPFCGNHADWERFDAGLSLLKEQEAKTPVEYEHNGYWYYICPTCGNHDEELLRQWNYCPFCGQAVKWG